MVTFGISIVGATMPYLYDASVGGITAIALPGNGLRGDISQIDLRALKNLQYLELSDNEFVGDLPHRFWKGKPKVHTVFLDSPDGALFRISGKLPENIARGLPNLRHLSLVNQAFRGRIPDFRDLNCTKVYVAPDFPACDFWFNGNEFEGTVPLGACDIQFNELYLGNNSLINCRHIPCVKAAYWAVPDQCDKSKCRKCTRAVTAV